MSVMARLAELEQMSTKELVAVWDEYFDHPPRSTRHREYLFTQLAYRVQELAYGGLSKRTKERLEDLAKSKLMRKQSKEADRPAIGTCFVRTYRDVDHHVTVTQKGYEYQGQTFTSLSAVATFITGTRWNGHVFFGLKEAKRVR
jgi:hypothetical protein